jgi:hypothetical protein
MYPDPVLPYWCRIYINSNIIKYQAYILFVICHMSYVMSQMSCIVRHMWWNLTWTNELQTLRSKSSKSWLLFHVEFQHKLSQSRANHNYLKHNAYCWFSFLVWQLIHVETWSKLILETIHLSCQNIQIMFLFSRSHYQNHFLRQIRYQMFETSMIMQHQGE